MTTLRLSILFCLLLPFPTTVLGQESETGTTRTNDEPLAVFRVAHDHAIGKGTGQLLVLPEGIAYRGESEHEERDSRTWRDDEIKRIEIDRDRIVVVAYEASTIPVIPRQLPGVDETKVIRTGSERSFRFDLLEGEVPPALVETLLARFPRPVATTVLPADDEASGRLLFELPVFHRHVSGGEHGVLRAYEHRLVFDTDREGHSRQWRYDDIRDIGSLGRYRFELATYETKRFTDGKSYIFELKEPLRQADYDALWRRVYERDPR